MTKEQLDAVVTSTRKLVWRTCFTACVAALALDHVGAAVAKLIAHYLWG